MIQLPKPVVTYFEAENAHDLHKALACFDKNAIVFDTGIATYVCFTGRLLNAIGVEINHFHFMLQIRRKGPSHKFILQMNPWGHFS